MNSSSQEVEVAIVPKGTRMKIHGCPFELVEDIQVFATQEEVDNILKIQQEWDSRPKTGKGGGILSMEGLATE